MSTRKTSIPAIPAVSPNNLEEVARAIKDSIEIREGLKGDPLDANVTFRDLSDGGIATYSLTGRGRGGVSLLPIGVDADGYDPAADLTVPPAPTNFTATGAFATIQLQWDGPPIRNLAYTEIWRSTTDVIGNAILIGTSDTNFYTDSIGNSATRYYWARHVSKANIFGPYNGTNGVVATTATNPSLVLASLTGQITESQLYSSLATRISLIDAPDTTSGSVNARVKTLQDSTTQSINNLQAQVNEIINIPAYSNTTTYTVDQQVTYNGSLYKAKSTTTGNLPTNTTYWTLIGNYTSLGDAVAAHTTQINTLNNGLATEISDRTTLYNQVNNATTGLPATRTLLINDYYTKNAADTAIASATSSLVSNTSLATTLGSYATTSFLASNNYTKTQTDSAISSATSNLVSTTTLTNTLGSYATTAYLSTNHYTKTQTDSAISSATLDLVSNTALSTTLGGYVTNSTLTNNYYTKSAVDGAISSASTTLTSNYGAADNAILSTAQSYTETYAYAKTDTYTKAQADSAISGQVSTVSARLNSGGDISTAINNVSNTASAKNANFVQSTTPTTSKVNDLWIDTGDSNKLKRWDGNAWVLADDARIGATATSVQTLQASVDATTSYRIDAWGFASSKTTFGVYNAAGTRLHTPTTGWSVLVLNRTTGVVVSHNSYNTYSNSANATSMANALDALGSDRVVVCYTYDEPRTNVYNNATLITALERCGATAAAIGNIKFRGAYILVGIPGRGAGTGYEKYAGAISSDPNAWITYTVQLVKGEPVGLGTSGAVALEIRADTQASSITGLQGQYTVKIDTAGHVTGFGLASTLNGSAPTSAFGVRANQFFVAPPSVSQSSAPTTGLYKGYVWVDTSTNPAVTKYYDGSSWSTTPIALPFVVQATPTTINNVAVPAGVYIDSAYIQNGTITNAKIGDAAIDTAKIANAAIVEAKIGDGEITNAKIGNFIQSNNYSAGTAGWKINKDGAAEFSNVIARGAIYASSGTIGSATIDSTSVQSTNYSANSAGWRLQSDGNAFFNNIAARGYISGGDINSWNWPPAGQSKKGFYLGSNGLLIGNANDNRYFYATVDGDVSMPGLSISGGSAVFSGTISASAANIVNTINLAGEAVTIPRSMNGNVDGIGSGNSNWRWGPYVIIDNALHGRPIIVIARVGQCSLPYGSSPSMGMGTQIRTGWEIAGSTAIREQESAGYLPYIIYSVDAYGNQYESGNAPGFRYETIMMASYTPDFGGGNNTGTVVLRVFAQCVSTGTIVAFQAKR